MLVRPKMATVYHCVALVARSQGYVSNQELQRMLVQSRSQIEQLGLRLVQIGVFKSVRGPRGGYALARLPEEINLYQLHVDFDEYEDRSLISQFVDDWLKHCTVRDLLLRYEGQLSNS